MGRRRESPDFLRSSRIISTPFHPSAEERALAGRLLLSERAAEREALGQRLLNAICRKLAIPPVRLRVIDSHQPHRLREGKLASKEYGVYHFDDHLIRIAHLTAVRGKVVAAKTFLDTLLHEFMHHLDRKHLRIPSTPHGPGFYSRIEDLKRKLAGSSASAAPTRPGEAPWAPPPKDLLGALERPTQETGPTPPRPRRGQPPRREGNQLLLDFEPPRRRGPDGGE